MEEDTFAWAAFKLALRNTLSLLRKRAFDGFVTLFSLVIGIPIFFTRYGMPGVTERFWELIAFGLAPGAALVFLALLWNLCVAPTELLHERLRASVTPTHAEIAPAQHVERKPPAPINWAIWKHMPEYTIEQFASILAKRDPEDLRTNHDETAFAKLLISDANDEKIPYIKEMGMNQYELRQYVKRPSGATKIKRSDAIKWAGEKGI